MSAFITVQLHYDSTSDMKHDVKGRTVDFVLTASLNVEIERTLSTTGDTVRERDYYSE